MPTVFSHPAPVLALAALLSGRVSTRMLLFGILCAVLPDADVIGFRFGISYADSAAGMALVEQLWDEALR